MGTAKVRYELPQEQHTVNCSPTGLLRRRGGWGEDARLKPEQSPSMQVEQICEDVVLCRLVATGGSARLEVWSEGLIVFDRFLELVAEFLLV